MKKLLDADHGSGFQGPPVCEAEEESRRRPYKASTQSRRATTGALFSCRVLLVVQPLPRPFFSGIAVVDSAGLVRVERPCAVPGMCWRLRVALC